MSSGPVSRSLVCREAGIRILVQAGGTIVAGRRPDSDIVLDCPLVGTRLFRLHNREGRLYLEDVGARVGIHVNGTALPRLGTRELSDGDCVQSAIYCFVVEPLSESHTE